MLFCCRRRQDSQPRWFRSPTHAATRCSFLSPDPFSTLVCAKLIKFGGLRLLKVSLSLSGFSTVKSEPVKALALGKYSVAETVAKGLANCACTVDTRLKCYRLNHKNDAPGKVFLPSMLTVYSKIPSSVATNLSSRVNTVPVREEMKRNSQISAISTPSDSHSN